MLDTRSWANTKAIEIAALRLSPSTIPLSGDARLALRNYRTLHLGDKDEKWRFLVQSIDEDSAHRLWFSDGGSEREKRTISRSEWPNYVVHVTDYLKEFEARYDSASRYLVAYLLDETAWSLIYYRLKNYLFTKRTLVRSDRMDVLRWILAESINDREFKTDPISLSTKLHTIRWIIHPQKDHILQYNILLLGSLTLSEDLIEKQGLSH